MNRRGTYFTLQFRRTKYQREDGSKYYGWSADSPISGQWDIQRHVINHEQMWLVAHNGEFRKNTFGDAISAKLFVQHCHDVVAEAEAARLYEIAEELVREEMQSCRPDF